MADIEERQRKLREKLETKQKHESSPKTLPPLESKPTPRRKSIVEHGQDILKLKSDKPIHSEITSGSVDPSAPAIKDESLLLTNATGKAVFNYSVDCMN